MMTYFIRQFYIKHYPLAHYLYSNTYVPSIRIHIPMDRIRKRCYV